MRRARVCPCFVVEPHANPCMRDFPRFERCCIMAIVGPASLRLGSVRLHGAGWVLERHYRPRRGRSFHHSAWGRNVDVLFGVITHAVYTWMRFQFGMPLPASVVDARVAQRAARGQEL